METERFKYRYFANLPQENSPKLCSVYDNRCIPVLKLPMTERETKTTIESTISIEIKENKQKKLPKIRWEEQCQLYLYVCLLVKTFWHVVVKTQVSLITLTLAHLYLSVPVSHDSMYNTAVKWNSDIINFIIRGAFTWCRSSQKNYFLTGKIHVKALWSHVKALWSQQPPRRV